MKRREALKNATVLLGFTISAGTAAAVLKGCKIDNSPDWLGEYLSKEQILLLEDVTERIIPKTDTPGAREANVVRFIDATLACNKEEDRMNFIADLGLFDQLAQENFQRQFIQCKEQDQKFILDKMVADASNSQNPRRHIFNKVKERTVVGFCLSEVGAKSFLKYDPIPGGLFEGCIDYGDVGANWAL